MEEIDFQIDLGHLRQRMTPAERHLIEEAVECETARTIRSAQSISVHAAPGCPGAQELLRAARVGLPGGRFVSMPRSETDDELMQVSLDLRNDMPALALVCRQSGRSGDVWTKPTTLELNPVVGQPLVWGAHRP